MSKRYQQKAKKRHSYYFYEAMVCNACKRGRAYNSVNCKVCLQFTGKTREIQKNNDMKTKFDDMKN
jgi:hypothetical protein